MESGFFAHHHPASPCCGDRDFGVRIIRSTNIDNVDIFAIDQFAPVRLRSFPSPSVRNKPSTLLHRDRTRLSKPGCMGGLKKLLTRRNAFAWVRPHKAVCSDDTDIQCFFRHKKWILFN